MTRYLFMFFILFQNVLYSQKEINIQHSIVKNTISIFNKLNIPIRTTLLEDSPIQIIQNDSIDMFNAAFHLGNYYKDIINYGTDSAYLTNPYIVVSPILYKVLFEKKDTTKNGIINAYASIVHEISHYLFTAFKYKNYFSPQKTDRDEMEKYIGQQYELFAFSVESYYYYQRVDKKFLRRLIKSSTIQEYILKALAAFRYKERYPWRDPIFPDMMVSIKR